MRELLDFFVNNSKWFVFMILVALSCAMLFSGNPYQHHVYLTSANAVTSSVYRTSDNVYSYFNLRTINRELNERNAQLQTEVMALRQMLQHQQDSTAMDSLTVGKDAQYRFIVAHVINNSISKPFNFLTINKGKADGLEPGMGVIDRNGVVGAVNVVAEHTSRVISVLNGNFLVSCKIKGSEHFGSLRWEGGNPQVAVLEDMPQHSQIKAGDTIVTTGFSNVFPPDIPVGIVMPPKKGEELKFNNLKIRLLTDFSTLSNVQVVENSLRSEITKVESSDYSTQSHR